MPREALLSRTFVELADTLVDEFDVVDLLTLLATRGVEVLGVSAAGVMLVAPEGGLRVVASSSEAMRVVELFELQHEEGPCLDCYDHGQPVLNQDLTNANGRWPRFAPVAFEAGFRMVHALPMRLRGTVIGAVNLFQADTRPIDPDDVLAGQAMADIGTIAILQHRAATEARVVNEQLTRALNSRIIIEQAKGVLAERAGLAMEEAFTRLRHHARNHNLLLADVAGRLIDGTLTTTALET
jgi:hypothetical protein